MQWVKTYFTYVCDDMEYDIIIIPYHAQQHWSDICAKVQNIYCLDSLPNVQHLTFHNLLVLKWVKELDNF